MHRRITRSIALALIGMTVMAPGIASADPSVSIAVNGTPFTDGSTGVNGQAIQVVGQGCTNPDGEAYMGLFVGQADPVLGDSFHPFETPVTDGGFSLDSTIEMDTAGTTNVRFYCATAPVSTIDDLNMLWVSPMTSMVIEQDPGLNAMAARTVSVKASKLLTAAATTNADGDNQLVIKIDPDALPFVDRVGITGDHAAALKAKVDARVEKTSPVQRLYSVINGKTPSKSDVDLWSRRVKTEGSLRKAAASMASSNEFKRAYGSLNDRQFIDKLYQANVGHAPDAAGRAFWLNKLASRRVTRSDVALDLSQSTEYTSRTESLGYVTAAFQVVGGRTPSNATVQTYVDQLDGGAYRVQVIEDIALTVHNAAWWNSHL